MGYNIEANDSIIKIVSFGEVSFKELNKQLEDILNYFEKKGLNKVFIDTDKVQEMPQTFDLYEFMSKLPMNISYAMYSEKNNQNNEALKFAETVSLNRYINIKLFSNKKEALDWLEQL